MVNKKKPWSTLSSKRVHTNPYYDVVHEKFVLPNQKTGDYYVLNSCIGSNNAVTIVPTHGRRIYFIKQYRYTIKKWTLELPGGGVPPGAQSRHMANDELREEIGFQANLWKIIGRIHPFISTSPEEITIYLAQDLVECERAPEESEGDSKVESFTIIQVYKMLDEGKFNDGQTIAALSLARKYLI